MVNERRVHELNMIYHAVRLPLKCDGGRLALGAYASGPRRMVS